MTPQVRDDFPTPLSRYVQRIRAERGLDREVPDFDPENGNERARFLFVLEAPGPKAVKTGFISFENPDQTAGNFKSQLQAARIRREEIALWNVVPWYIGNKEKTRIRSAKNNEIALGVRYLVDLLQLLPELRCIVLVGGAARRAHVPLSAKTTVRILSCHHPSPRAMNLGKSRREENMAVLEYMRASTV